jgi:hypothetical protein
MGVLHEELLQETSKVKDPLKRGFLCGYLIGKHNTEITYGGRIEDIDIRHIRLSELEIEEAHHQFKEFSEKNLSTILSQLKGHR